MRRMKHIMAVLAWCLPAMVVADEVKVVYMTLTTADGKTQEARLSISDGTVLPRFYTSENVLNINSAVYNRDEISSIRFDVRTEEANSIRLVEAAEAGDVPGAVYSISGKLVRAHSESLEGLPKGIYIINKKKVVVK